VIAPRIEHAAQRLDADGVVEVRETLAEETPVALLFNGEAHAVMMATPQDLEDFALGFALTEGIVAAADELRFVEALPRGAGIALHLAIPSVRFEALQTRRRSLTGRSGCGLCGAETLEQAIVPVRRVTQRLAVAPERLSRAFVALAARQTLNRDCGGLHAAAALCGEEVIVREDVGRHNALDKAIGALLRAGRRADALLLTSRASYELVHKAAAADIGTLAAMSAPTAYAVRLAQEAGLALYAFAREDRITRYA
jgi:formate dehydrogenase accessory protein FdhD